MQKNTVVICLGKCNENYCFLGYIVMLRARMFRSLIPVLMIKERNIRARNITIQPFSVIYYHIFGAKKLNNPQCIGICSKFKMASLL